MNSKKTHGSSPNGLGRGNYNLGNEVGHATRFQKGKSGNPGGRPSQTPFADAARIVADLSVDELEDRPTDSVSLRWAKRLASDALSGKTQAAVELANRAEGPPRRTEPSAQGDFNIRIVYDDPAAEAEARKRKLAEMIKELESCPDGAQNSAVKKENSGGTE
jgi:Family of unknown function (DUF5681)